MFYTVAATAKLLGVNPSTIYKEIKSKRLGAIRLGGPDSKRPAVRIPAESLKAWEAALLLEAQK